MANRYAPHLLVLPEDDANRQVANGFASDHFVTNSIQVLPPVGGWGEVLRRFRLDLVPDMARYRDRFVVLLMDFDHRKYRLEHAKKEIPEDLCDRVFVLGAWTEPEDLKRELRSDYEGIGLALARDCREGTKTTWGHELLRHNEAELARLRQRILPILFPSANPAQPT